MLTNIYWIIPEIYLTFNIINFLIFALIFSKLNKQITQELKFIWLNIYILIITSILFLEQINIYETIQVSFNFLTITPLSTLIKLILSISTIAILLLSKSYFINKWFKDFEYFSLILLAILGMFLLVEANDLIVLYLSIELFSLSSYILATILKNSEFSTEAGLKYFVLGSLSSGLLLFGSTVLYVFTGETNFTNISYLIWYNNSFELIMGIIFILIAILFKLAAAPFHMWAPDVYEGAPTIITAFFAIVPKIALIGLFINLIWFSFYGVFNQIQPILIVVSILSMMIGSIGALNQTKIKRLVAYSAISHIGFILLGLLCGTIYGVQATIIYILIYIIMSIATFNFILISFKNTNYISELSGLSRKNLLLAMSFSLILFSIAGIPPLAGFFSKYIVLLEALNNNLIALTIIGVIASSIAIFYYIRIIKWMFFKDSTDFIYKDLADIVKPQITINLNQSIMLAITTYLIISILLYPNFLINITFELISNSLL